MRRPGVRGTCVVVAIIGALSVPDASAGQALEAGLGLAGGLVAGAYMTTGAYVLKSRATGWVLHSVEDLMNPRPAALPLIVAPVAGTILGYRSPAKLGAAAIWGGAGLIVGGVVGAGIGQWIWKDTTGRWAGATIGSAAGLAIGAILGAVLKDTSGDEGPASVPMLTVSLPIGGSR